MRKKKIKLEINLIMVYSKKNGEKKSYSKKKVDKLNHFCC